MTPGTANRASCPTTPCKFNDIIPESFSGVFRADGATAPLWSGREFLDNLCTVFASFVSRLNRNIRVPRLRVTLRVFCLSKTALKCTQTSLFGQKWFFSNEGPTPFTTPTPVDAYATLPFLTEILQYKYATGAIARIFGNFHDDAVTSFSRKNIVKKWQTNIHRRPKTVPHR